jgi:phage-related protein
MNGMRQVPASKSPLIMTLLTYVNRYMPFDFDAALRVKPLGEIGSTKDGLLTVLEIVESHDGNAYRVVYTVRFREIIYVPHASRKKSKRGIATPPQELDKVNARLMQAEQEYETWRRRNR